MSYKIDDDDLKIVLGLLRELSLTYPLARISAADIADKTGLTIEDVIRIGNYAIEREWVEPNYAGTMWLIKITQAGIGKLENLDEEIHKKFDMHNHKSEPKTFFAKRKIVITSILVAAALSTLIVNSTTLINLMEGKTSNQNLITSIPNQTAGNIVTLHNENITSSHFLSNPVTLPNNWTQVNAIAAFRNITLIGGADTYGHGTLGIYHLSDSFTDISSLLPSSYSSISTIAYGGGIFLVGGASASGGVLGSYDLSTHRFQDLTQLLGGADMPLNSISWDGQSFLIGGASHKYTFLGLYFPTNSSYLSLTNTIPYYFAINHIVWNGKAVFFINGAKAGRGGEPGTLPAVGYIYTVSNSFEDLSTAVPPSLGVMGNSAYDGNVFLIQGYSTIDSEQMVEVYDPFKNTFINVTDIFPRDLIIRSISAGNNVFLIGGKLAEKHPYLVLFDYPSNSLKDLSPYIPNNVKSVSFGMILPGRILIGGIYDSGQAYFDMLNYTMN